MILFLPIVVGLALVSMCVNIIQARMEELFEQMLAELEENYRKLVLEEDENFSATTQTGAGGGGGATKGQNEFRIGVLGQRFRSTLRRPFHPKRSEAFDENEEPPAESRSERSLKELRRISIASVHRFMPKKGNFRFFGGFSKIPKEKEKFNSKNFAGGSASGSASASASTPGENRLDDMHTTLGVMQLWGSQKKIRERMLMRMMDQHHLHELQKKVRRTSNFHSVAVQTDPISFRNVSDLL